VQGRHPRNGGGEPLDLFGAAVRRAVIGQQDLAMKPVEAQAGFDKRPKMVPGVVDRNDDRQIDGSGSCKRNGKMT